MEYKLWDVESGSYVGKYTNEADALATVEKLINKYGPEYAESLSLGRITDDGRALEPLTGQELLGRERMAAAAKRQPA